MNVTAMLADLYEQRQQIDHAIAVFQRLASGQGGKRRGRPPAWMKEGATAAAAAPAAKRTGRTYTEAQKREASLRMKKRWAAKKKAEGKS